MNERVDLVRRTVRALLLLATTSCDSADLRPWSPDAASDAAPPSTDMANRDSSITPDAESPPFDAGDLDDAGADAGPPAPDASDPPSDDAAPLDADEPMLDAGEPLDADAALDARALDATPDAPVAMDASRPDASRRDSGPCDAGSTEDVTFVFRGPALTDDTEIGTHQGSHPHAGWNNGARPDIQIAQTVYTQWRRSRALVRFPVDELPPGMTIRSVTLRLHVEAQCVAPSASRADTGCDEAASVELDVATLLRAWREGRGRYRDALAGESSWSSTGAEPWATAGAEGASDRSAPIDTVSVWRTTDWLTVNVTASIRAAYEAGSAHHGFVLSGPESPTDTRHHRVVVSTSESADEVFWPELVVEGVAPGCTRFEPIGTPAPPPYDAGPPCTSTERGLTIMDRGRVANGSSYVGKNCQGSYPPECVPGDLYAGETLCSERHPMMCVRGSSMYAQPDEHPYGQWRGYAMAFTDPVQGCQLTSLARANEICVAHFGPGWRILDNRELGHDGWFWGDDLIPETVEPWRRRFWVDVNDQPAACWE